MPWPKTSSRVYSTIRRNQFQLISFIEDDKTKREGMYFCEEYIKLTSRMMCMRDLFSSLAIIMNVFQTIHRQARQNHNHFSFLFLAEHFSERRMSAVSLKEALIMSLLVATLRTKLTAISRGSSPPRESTHRCVMSFV